MARQGLTIRQLGATSRDGVPRRALLVNLVTNLCLIFLLGDLLAIVAAGNIGYLIAHILALSGFVLLRRDRPGAERPIRVHRVFVPVAAALVVLLAIVLVVGAASFDLTGYGDVRELAVALCVLGLSVVLFAVRRVLQDGGRLRLRAPADASTPRGQLL